MEDGLISVQVPQETRSIIKVIGVGGGGSNAVNHMCQQGIYGVEFVICNTDLQALHAGEVRNRIQIGKALTSGLGAGCNPDCGRDSLRESEEFIRSILSDNTKMLFIAAGMGGGTGTGAAPEIARIARELDILTIGIVTMPFSFEGSRKMQLAMNGVEELEKNVDALILIINDKLIDIYGDLKLSEAFSCADNVLTIAAKSIAEIITTKGYVNTDFADVNSIMRNSGKALIGAATVGGEDRAVRALESALESPLLSNFDIRGASNILLYIHYGVQEATMDELMYITNTIRDRVGGKVDMIWGAGDDPSLPEDALRVTIVAVGFKAGNYSTIKETNKKTEKLQSPFRVEEIENIEMLSEEPLDENQQEQRVQTQTRRGGKNSVPDVDNWFKKAFGGSLDDFFSESSGKDPEIH